MIGLIVLTVCVHGVISSGQVISVAELSAQSRAEEDQATVTKRGALVIQTGRPDATFESTNGSGAALNSDGPVAQVNVIQVYVLPAKRKKRLRAFDHLPGCPNDAIQFIKTSNFDGSLKQHVFRTAFAVNTDECANLCHTHYFCHSAGYQPSSNRCLLSYKRSNIVCDWSAAPTREPSLSDDIRPSSWVLTKGNQDQDDTYEDDLDEDDSDVWLDCFRCGIVFGVNGTNTTVTFINETGVDSLKHEFDFANVSLARHSNASTLNETDFGHRANVSGISEGLNSSLPNVTHSNDTDLFLSNATHGNASVGNATDLGRVNLTRVNSAIGFNDSIPDNVANETHANWTSSPGNHSSLNNSLVNETIGLLTGNETYHVNFLLTPANASQERNLTETNVTLHSNGSFGFENESLQSNLNATLENATLHSNLTQENVTVQLNQTSNLTLNQNLTSESNLSNPNNASLETLHILNATTDSEHLLNASLANSTEHDNLTSDNTTLHQNLTSGNDLVYHNLTAENASLSSNWTLENATLTGNLSSENGTLRSNLTLENATLHSNLTVENSTLSSNLTSGNTTLHPSNVTVENGTDLNFTSPHAISNSSLSNATEGDQNVTAIPDQGNTTSLDTRTTAPFIRLFKITTETPVPENGTVSVTTRRARKFTRRPYTRHVEIVGNFSSPAGAFVGSTEQGF